MIEFYNTLTRNLEEFKPIKNGEVGIYSCGPTVYWNQHIGNMYAFTQWDLLTRFLRYAGYKTKWVMNITDVGHKTSDADEGEDKMEKGARREGIDPWKIADKYIAQFLESMDLMNIQRPDVLCRATEHIPEQIELIKKIESRGFAYHTQTGLVFDTSKFPGYADLARLKLDEQNAGSRVEIDVEKRHPCDFLLWINNQPNHIMQWDSPWGRGFPGWHIECTAMSIKYLDEKFDIHTGGKEHIPVHHTNEIAQAYGAFGRQTANYWLHNEWLYLKDAKLSKSGGETILVTDLQERGFSPLHLRYLFLTSHYRTGLVFSWESLGAARQAYERLSKMVINWATEALESKCSEADVVEAENFTRKFSAACSRDLNFSAALAVVWETAKSQLSAQTKLSLIKEFDKVLGLNLVENQKSPVKQDLALAEKIKNLIFQREEMRRAGNWAKADKLREELLNLGYEVADPSAVMKHEA